MTQQPYSYPPQQPTAQPQFQAPPAPPAQQPQQYGQAPTQAQQSVFTGAAAANAPHSTDSLFGGGASLSFADPACMNVWRGGVIVTEPKESQQTAYRTNEPLFFKDGSPRMQVVVTLATTERDPADPADTGHRQLFIKANMLKAVGAALRAAGAPGLRVGGTLYVMWSGNGAAQAGNNPPKLYQAQYSPPGAPTDAAFAQAAQPAPQQYQPPQQAPAPPAPQPYQPPAQTAPAPPNPFGQPVQQYQPPAQQQAPQGIPTIPNPFTQG